jgi:hypothetical protein
VNPTVMYFLNLAQRAGNTPAGQAFLRMAQNAANRVINAETKFPTLPRGPAGQFPARPFFGDKLPVAPISRGAAGLAGAAGVGMGSGQFEGVRDSVMGSSEPAPSPNPLFSQLDRSASASEPRPLTIPGGRQQIRPMDSTLFGEDAGPRPSPMIASDSTLAGYDMPPAARAAVNTARTVMPQNPPLPPPRQRDEAPAPMSSRDLWERYSQTGSAADFVRADAATPRPGRAEGGGLDPMGGLMPPDMATMPVDAPMPMPPMPADAAPPPSMDGPKAPAAGGGAGGRDAAINKALDIIHNLVTRQRI